jgi:hypothetical protein
MQNELLAKLNAKYRTADFTRRANAGDWSGAADSAAGLAWGVWSECRTAAGLAGDSAAQSEKVAAMMAAKKSKFSR